MARNDGIDRTSVRNLAVSDKAVGNTQQHNEREKDSYRNPDIIPQRAAFTRLWNSHVAALVPFSLHPHMLRHTYATTLYRAGVDLRTAQKLMGHSSIQVTADIYTHLEQEDSLHVADKLNEYLSGKSENSAKSSQKVVKLAI